MSGLDWLREKGDEMVCFDARLALFVLTESSCSENVGDVGDRWAYCVGVGERNARLVNDIGEPISAPDNDDGGRLSVAACPADISTLNDCAPALPPSRTGESGRAGERVERDIDDADRSK